VNRLAHLGLDVGGTASRWVACADDGSILARGQGPGATGHVFNPAEKERLGAMLQAAAVEVDRAGLMAGSFTAGITGYGDAVAEDVKGLIGTAFGVGADKIILSDDIVLAFAAHFEPGAGHLVSAGTGSIGVHIGAAGEMVRVGGRGILIDDGGSGSRIALGALDRLYRLHDEDGNFSRAQILADAMFAQIGGTDWSAVRQFVYGGDRGRVGTLAVAVAQAAEAGDALAFGLLDRAGEELARLALALLARAGEHPVRFVGGVLDLHPAVFAAVERRLAGRATSRAQADAALAAAQMQTGVHTAWRDVLAR